MLDAAKDKKDIDYHCGPVAKAAHESPAKVKLAWGPLGTAKTSWLCWRVWFLAMDAAQAGYSLRALLLRDTYRNLVDSTLQTFLRWFPEAVGEQLGVGKMARSVPVDYRLFVGGRFHDVCFRHGQTEQDASALLSTEYDFIGLEEVAPAYLPGEKHVSPGISEGVFDMALTRLTREVKRAEAIGPELCITCNSPPLTHWASKRIIDKPKDYLESLNWAQWMFPVSDNAHNITADYYSSLEKAWEGKRALIARFLRGERLAVFVGLPRFNLDQLDELQKKAVEPSFRGFLTETRENILHVKPELNKEGYVCMWAPPVGNKRYVIGADVAEGIEGGDYSAAYVLDREDCSIAAAWHGHMEPEMFATELAKLGVLYNQANIGVENNNHGLTTLTALKNLGYPRIYIHKSLDLRTKGIDRLGFRTTPQSKYLLIDGVGGYLDAIKTEGTIVDGDLISELMTFGVDETGKLGAQEGCFDDRVISFALALLVNQRDGLERIFSNLNRN